MQVGWYIHDHMVKFFFTDLHISLALPSTCNSHRHKYMGTNTHTHTTTTVLRPAGMLRYTCLCWMATLFELFLTHFFPLCKFGRAWNPARRLPILHRKAKQQHHPTPDVWSITIAAGYTNTARIVEDWSQTGRGWSLQCICTSNVFVLQMYVCCQCICTSNVFVLQMY